MKAWKKHLIILRPMKEIFFDAWMPGFYAGPTYWNKAEVTVLIEQMKNSKPNQHTFTGAVKGISTELTPEY